jgi:hypothetical protein
VNYNLPLRDNTLAERLVNMDLISGEAKVMQTGPEIKHVGINPCFNDIFLGSKGMFGIPLDIMMRVNKTVPPTEKLWIELK